MTDGQNFHINSARCIHEWISWMRACDEKTDRVL